VRDALPLACRRRRDAASVVEVEVDVMRVRRFAETYGEGEPATVASLGAVAMVTVCPSATVVGRPGASEGVS
jgi:hypothetical protein